MLEWLGGTVVFEAPRALYALVLLLVVVGWTWRARAGFAPGLDRGVALALLMRLAAAGAVVLSLAGLSLERLEPAEDLCVVMAVDVSESMGDAGLELASEWSTKLVGSLREQDRYGLVAFADRAQVVQWPSAPPHEPLLSVAGIERDTTQIASGIDAALPVCPDGVTGKVLLISDGNETVGDARRAAALAAQAGVRLYAVAPGSGADDGFSFEKLTAPPLVREGSVFPLRLVVRGRSAATEVGSIGVLLDGEVVSEQPVRIDPGLNVFEIPYQLRERGSYRLGALVSQGEVADQRELSLAVAGPIRALVVSTAKHPPLARALQIRDVDVEFIPPDAFPSLDNLLAYHCVIIDDVRRAAFSDDALEAIESYVESFGGGLLMTGGPESFGDKRYRGSRIERALPIRFEEQKPRPRGRTAMGVFLLIDRSNSMSYNSRRRDTRDGEKMSYAKKAAQAMVAQLKPNDQVGVIAFDSDPYVLGPLKKLSDHRLRLEDRIARLLPGGGTDFKASLEIAAAQLTASGLSIRHVILLTDGDTNRGAKDHDALVTQLASLGISVTTIRIGTDDVNLDLLRRISRDTGGQFYHVQDIERLPQLVVSDTRKVSRERQDEQPSRFRLRIGKRTPVIRGFQAGDFPALRQLVRADLKRGADQVLYGVDGRSPVPLLATWQYGLGRTGAFLLDPSAPEARHWISWSGFAKLWSQLVRWVIREEAPWESQHLVRFEGGEPVLELQTFDPETRGEIVAQIFTSPGESVDVALSPISPRVYRGALPSLPSGRYALLLKRVHRGMIVAQKRDVLVLQAVVDEEGSPELARKLPDLELLRDVTTVGGGSLDPDLDEILRREGRTVPVRASLDVWLIPLALALLLGDIWLRRRVSARFG